MRWFNRQFFPTLKNKIPVSYKMFQNVEKEEKHFIFTNLKNKIDYLTKINSSYFMW